MNAPDHTDNPIAAWQRGSVALAKRIFKADFPEQFIRAIPSQSLYCVLQHNGLESSGELLELATIEQCRLLLDFDLWSKDRFDENKFWDWLAVTDTTEELELLQKLFKAFDLKLVALLIARHVSAQTFDEPTNEPPGEHYYTPDKGSTWIHVETADENRDFLLNRLLALIFETDADLFYQMLAIPGLSTDAQLEEESYMDRQRRLYAEGIPEEELAYDLHAPLYFGDIEKELQQNSAHSILRDIFVVEPLLYDSEVAAPLKRLLAVVKDRETAEGELTYIINAAIIRWGTPFHDPAAVHDLVNKVKGTVALGIELLENRFSMPLDTLYSTLGIQKIYRIGLTAVMNLRRSALKLNDQQLENLHAQNPTHFKMVAFLREPFPCLPGESPHAVEETYAQPIDSLTRLQAAESALKVMTEASHS